VNLEVLPPASDVDRAKRVCETLRWRLNADLVISDDFRVVQFAPPGSECSIIFRERDHSGRPGSVEALRLTVFGIDVARSALVCPGIDVCEVSHDAGGVFRHAGTEGRAPGPAAGLTDYGSFASFSDPDGNGWLLQEIKTRARGR
jgi:hypothetical protein